MKVEKSEMFPILLLDVKGYGITESKNRGFKSFEEYQEWWLEEAKKATEAMRQLLEIKVKVEGKYE